MLPRMVAGRDLFDRRLASPVLLRGIGPRRAERKQYKPSFCELTGLYSVALHARATARLAGFRISPPERKTKPRAITFERVIIDDDPDTWPLLVDGCDLRCVSLPRYRPVALLVVPNIVRSDATWDEVILGFVPHSLPSIEQVAYGIFRHRQTFSCFWLDGYRRIVAGARGRRARSQKRDQKGTSFHSLPSKMPLAPSLSRQLYITAPDSVVSGDCQEHSEICKVSQSL